MGGETLLRLEFPAADLADEFSHCPVDQVSSGQSACCPLCAVRIALCRVCGFSLGVFLVGVLPALLRLLCAALRVRIALSCASRFGLGVSLSLAVRALLRLLCAPLLGRGLFLGIYLSLALTAACGRLRVLLRGFCAGGRSSRMG